MRLMQLTSTEGILTNRDWGREGVGCKLAMNQLISDHGTFCHWAPVTKEVRYVTIETDSLGAFVRSAAQLAGGAARQTLLKAS
jgi:hypothetical protein